MKDFCAQGDLQPQRDEKSGVWNSKGGCKSPRAQRPSSCSCPESLFWNSDFGSVLALTPLCVRFPLRFLVQLDLESFFTSDLPDQLRFDKVPYFWDNLNPISRGLLWQKGDILPLKREKSIKYQPVAKWRLLLITAHSLISSFVKWAQLGRTELSAARTLSP
jgi:hypothetical protein